MLGILSSGAASANAATVEQLEAQMRAMQAQLRAMQQQVNQAKADAAAAKGSNGENIDLKVKWKGAPELSSSDGKFKFKVRGRLMVDYNGINQDQSITGEPDINGVELRRARLGVEGVLYYDWKYKFEVDFAGNESEIKDAYIAYDFGMWEILAGNFKVANSLEEMTSSRFITFMERAAFIEAFALGRRIGAGVHGGGDMWSLQAGYYGSRPGDQETWFDDQTAGAVRATVAPVNTDTTVVHLGASYRHRNAGTLDETGSAELFRYRAHGAELHLADRFVATPRVGESDDMFVLEGALVFKSVSVQGEYAQLETNIPTNTANANPTYDGWYVDANWFITGEMRNYKASEGEFSRVKVKNPVWGGSGGWGAWQVAGRYDVIDLSDAAGAIAAGGIETCTDCGKQETWLIGLNWWMTDHTALKLQVSQSEISGPGVNNGADITGVGLRAQVDW
jgi:phosphate-selective porin OprO/OprP